MKFAVHLLWVILILMSGTTGSYFFGTWLIWYLPFGCQYPTLPTLTSANRPQWCLETSSCSCAIKSALSSLQSSSATRTTTLSKWTTRQTSLIIFRTRLSWRFPRRTLRIRTTFRLYLRFRWQSSSTRIMYLKTRI